MKSYKSYILGMAAAAAAGLLAGCQDDFDKDETVEAPVATIQPNMTILELKQKYWDDATNYIDTIGVENGVSDGQSYVISGRVVSSDEAGNVFKSLVIQDETAALALSINSYNLYLNYRVGQEVVLDLNGMYIGKYNGLQQLGMPEWYANGNAWEATFMAPEFFEMHAQRNGFPEPAKIDTLEINSFSELPSNPDGLMKWQSQLVKFNNVYFQNAGTEQFSEYHSSGVNQNIVDVDGSTLPVRTSGYSNFWNNYLPQGNGDVVCILSYYGTTGWQLLLNDYQGCMNFGNPTVAPGTEDNPLDVNGAIELINSGATRAGWVKGYIVGAVAPEVESISGNGDIEWSGEVVLDNTLVIGQTADTKDLANALIINLPEGSALRQYGNLVDNPANYQKEIWVKGTFGMYMGAYGVLGNTGSASQFKIEGVTIDSGEVPAGDGTEASPYNVQQVIAKNPTGNGDNPDEKDVWVEGYIVGWADMSSIYYINAETSRFTVPATVNTNILLAPTADVADYSKCIGIQLPSGNVRNGLNLQDNPGNLGRKVSIKGNIAKYSGVPGLRSASQYVFDGDAPGPDTPSAGEPKGTGTAEDPYNATKAIEVAQANGETSETSVYTGGYVISGSIDTTYGNGTWTIADNADGTGSTIKVFRAKYFNNQSFTDADKVKNGDYIVVYAPLINYYGNTPETNLGYLYSINGETGDNGGGGEDPDEPDEPDTPVTDNSADFNTFNGGKAVSAYADYSTTSGWKLVWGMIAAGGTDATNFLSADATTLIPVIDGSKARPGSLTSPTISGGIGTLKFTYGFPYNESKCQFTVNIKQDGSVVATDTVTLDSITKGVAMSYSHEFNVKGDFVIEIVNDLYSNAASGNKDRIALVDLTWTSNN
ncbi:MAG: DUF5689 domain-containing protein [Clostridium sp.]|nr:DUF5689 domain-containing protein [Clostridium sp.]